LKELGVSLLEVLTRLSVLVPGSEPEVYQMEGDFLKYVELWIGVLIWECLTLAD
jgi:hypothetical protein